MKFLKKLLWILFPLLILTYLYTNSLIGVAPKVKTYYQQLKERLVEKGHSPALWVISGRRWEWDNYLLYKFGNAARNSRHLKGEAIDIIVLDVNKDGNINGADVDIVQEILDKEIVKSEGGVGTYKYRGGFFNQQMVHFDCRGTQARWKK